MASKQKTAPPSSESRKALKVGSRVRCTDDGVEGRLVWTNATAVKIRWDDGEQVTWRRDSLADRPLEILDPPAAEPTSLPDEPAQAPAPQPATEQATAESPSVADAEPPTVEQLPPLQVPAPEQAVQPPSAEPAQTEPVAADPTQSEGAATQPAEEQAEAAEPATEKKKRQRKTATVTEGGTNKKLSAIDAAAQVLAQASAPLNCQELIEAMAAQGLWSSPAGKTPAATLYSALLREIQTKGEQARFVKAERGKFTLRITGAQA